MKFFSHNGQYYQLPKYQHFLLNHPVYISISRNLLYIIGIKQEISVHIYQVTQLQIPEDSNLFKNEDVTGQ
jgi:hypothetical protein